MRKLNKGRKLSRPANQRKALLRTMATSLFIHGKIKTTEAKAKTLRSIAEKFITRAKTDTIQTRRILKQDFNPIIVKKLVEEIAPIYSERKGGYTRITKLPPRNSDGARVVILELIK